MLMFMMMRLYDVVDGDDDDDYNGDDYDDDDCPLSSLLSETATVQSINSLPLFSSVMVTQDEDCVGSDEDNIFKYLTMLKFPQNFIKRNH